MSGMTILWVRLRGLRANRAALAVEPGFKPALKNLEAIGVKP